MAAAITPPPPRAGRKIGHLRADRGDDRRGHQEIANQDPARARGRHAKRVRAAHYSTSPHNGEGALRQDAGAPAREVASIHLERPQIPVVDADDCRLRPDGGFHLVFAVHLEQDLESPESRVPRESRKALVRRHGGGNEQNHVRSGQHCLVHLDLVDDEVLSEDGDAHCSPNRAQIARYSPRKYVSSVSTETADAPPCAYTRARSAGSDVRLEHAFRRALRLISAITPSRSA